MARNRLPQNIARVPLKVTKPLALKQEVHKSMGKERLAGICVTEISQLFLCLKKYTFNQEACSKEIELFQNCYNQHVAKYGKPADGIQNDLRSVTGINKLLKRFT